MAIRLATVADIPAMHHVRVAVRENAPSSPGRIAESDYVAALAGGRGWVALDVERVVGFAIGLATGNVWALFVHPDAEGRGHGSALHAALLPWLERHAARPIWLSTMPGTRAERFYLAHGWQDRGLLPSGERRFERAEAV